MYNFRENVFFFFWWYNILVIQFCHISETVFKSNHNGETTAAKLVQLKDY